MHYQPKTPKIQKKKKVMLSVTFETDNVNALIPVNIYKLEIKHQELSSGDQLTLNLSANVLIQANISSWVGGGVWLLVVCVCVFVCFVFFYKRIHIKRALSLEYSTGEIR